MHHIPLVQGGGFGHYVAIHRGETESLGEDALDIASIGALCHELQLMALGLQHQGGSRRCAPPQTSQPVPLIHQPEGGNLRKTQHHVGQFTPLPGQNADGESMHRVCNGLQP